MGPRIILAAMVAASAAAPALAADVKAGDLSIQGPVLRSAPKGVANTAGYATIVNAGASTDRLLSASCACAAKVEFHVSHVMNGMAMMMPETAVEIPARGRASFSAGGRHLMVLGLKSALTDGSVQTVTLKFQRAGTVKVPFRVMSRVPLQARGG